MPMKSVNMSQDGFYKAHTHTHAQQGVLSSNYCPVDNRRHSGDGDLQSKPLVKQFHLQLCYLISISTKYLKRKSCQSQTNFQKPENK